MADTLPTRILRLPEVKARVGLSRTSLYKRIACGEFPKQIRLGARAVGWLAEDINDWIADQIERSRKSAPRVT